MAKNKKMVIVKKTKKNKKKQGQEMTRLGAALRALGSMGGAAAGGLFGMPAAGTGMGHSLGGALSKWLGSGDYTVGTNSIVRQMKSSQSIPMMHNDGQSITVRHKEYLGEIPGTTGYTVFDSFGLNPGNSRTFPWLSRLASNFQEYKFKGVVFHYIPTSGNAVAGTGAPLGSVMIQTSYRSTDTAPTSKLEMLNEYNSSEAVPSETFAHPVECDPKENPFNVQYVRNGAVPDGDSTMMYDLGTTYVATSGQAGTTVLGDLWVTYEVELKKPLLNSNVTSDGKSGYLTFNTAPTTGSFFTGTPVVGGNVAVAATGKTITMPRGSVGDWILLIELRSNTGTITTWTPGSFTLTNCVARAYNLSSSIQTVSPTLAGTGTLNRVLLAIGLRVTDQLLAPTIATTASFTGTAEQANITLVRVSDLEV